MRFRNFIYSKSLENTHNVINILGLKFKIRRPVLKYLETHIVDHCNLNCKACHHFCPLAPENYVKVENFESDIKEISKKFYLKRFRIMGGEPLLHPQVCEFLAIARRYLPSTNISIVTNCILLPQMKEEFWDTCRKYDIKIDMSQYPIVGDKETFKQKYFTLVENHNVKIGEVHWADKFWSLLNYKGDSDIKKTFENCDKFCKTLRNGRLITCSLGSYFDFYNNYFGTNIPEAKGIDIYKNDAKTILKYLNTPMETCRYCTQERHYFEWGRTEKKKEEWFIGINSENSD